MRKPDHSLESDVKDELHWDPLLDDSRITVKTNDGKVTLIGAVDSYQERTLASEDAWTVYGTTAVDNELLVGLVGEAILDADLAARCEAALDAERAVPERAVTVSVSDGWVTLKGEVPHHFQRAAAKHAVGKVDGVLGLTDSIVIGRAPVPDDVADRVNKAFSRNAIIDDSLIEVFTSGSTVYLEGTASSWYAMDAAVNAAWQAPGVTDVVNRLVIVP